MDYLFSAFVLTIVGAATIAAIAPVRQHILIFNMVIKGLTPFTLNHQPNNHQGDYPGYTN
jgi:hypothetical protein